MPARLSIVDRFRQRTPRSAALAENARQLLPSGLAHDSRQQLPYPIYVDHAAGSRKWDVDGHEYVDYSGGHGALLLGHNHPAVVAAVAGQLQRGTHFGACHDLEIRWAQAVRDLIPSAERIRFTSSGTEATLLALRLARAATGRRQVIRLAGHFHGWHDHVAQAVSAHFDGSPSVGVLPEVAASMLVVPPGDLAALERALPQQHDVAAVILEPTGASWGKVPLAPSFVRHLRQLTAQRGVLLIFDEVISGFRCAPGGAQQALGIRPDLTTLAKILAGGLPGGALVGRADLFDLLDFQAAAASGREKISHHGTFNANPLSAAAGVATLNLVAHTDACAQANQYAARLRSALNRTLAEHRLGWIVYGTYSGFHIFTNPQRLPLSPAQFEAGNFDGGNFDWQSLLAKPRPELLHKLRLAMLLGGVELFSWPGGPTSAVHTDADLAQTVAAWDQALTLLRDEGELDLA